MGQNTKKDGIFMAKIAKNFYVFWNKILNTRLLRK